MESFEAAKSEFEAFLVRLNRPAKVVWVFREDISQIGWLTFFKASNLPEDETRVQGIYSSGVANGLGVTLSGRFFTRRSTFAYIWIPENDDDAGRHLQGRCLKLSALDRPTPESKRIEIEVRSRWLWLLVEAMNQKGNSLQGHFEDIPFRRGSKG